jgi:hypothetical protein
MAVARLAGGGDHDGRGRDQLRRVLEPELWSGRYGQRAGVGSRR